MTHEQPSPARTVEPIGLAIASLVLGIMSLPFSMFLIGGIMGVIGIVVGAVYLAKPAPYRQMARWGVGLSLVGLVSSAYFGYQVWKLYNRAHERSRVESLKWEAWEGVRAPDLSVTTLDGQTIRLSELRGKRVVLDFWATWCPPCVKEIPHYIELVKDPEAKDVIVIGISSENASKLNTFVNEHGVNYAIASASDEMLPEPYRSIRSIPTTFFIDRNGVIQTVFEGYRDYEDLRAAALAADYQGEVREPNPTSSGTEASADKS